MSNNEIKKNIIEIIVATIAGILVLLFGYFVLQDTNTSKTIINVNDSRQQTNVNDSGQQLNVGDVYGTIIINQVQPTIEPIKSPSVIKQPKEVITVTETGTGTNFYKHKAIELAEENALNKVKGRNGINVQIINYKFSEPKIDSLPNKIMATVEVSATIKK